MGLISDVLAFSEAVFINWRTGTAAVIFLLFSFPNAVLSERRKNWLEGWLPAGRRRVIASALAVAWIFVASFQAWEAEHTARVLAESNNGGNGRHLTADQRSRLISGLTLPLGQSIHIEFNSVPNCDECEVFAEELREFVGNIPGWKADGGVITFSGFEKDRGLYLSPNTSNTKLVNLMLPPFELASLPLQLFAPADYVKGLDGVVVVARRPK